MNNKKTIVEFGFRFASVDNNLIDLHNSSHPTLPHSIVAKYKITSLSPHKESVSAVRCQEEMNEY